MFMFQKTDSSIGHGTVNIVLVLAMWQAKIHPPSLHVTKCPAKLLLFFRIDSFIQ